MSRFLTAINGCLVLVTVLAAPARADVFVLSNGGRIEGKLLNPKESPREAYVVESNDGARVVLQQKLVDQRIVKSDLEASYEEALPMVEDNEAGHWEMASKCKKAGLKDQETFHLEQVLRHNPEHVDARRALGYNRVDGRWQRQDEFMEKQGFVRHRGGWRLPQELQIEQHKRANEQEIVAWRKKVKLWRDWIIKGRDRAAEGLANMRAIRDPRAAAALAAQLRNPKESKPLKQLYIDIFFHFPDNGTAVGALTYIALHDPDKQVREKALDVLSRNGSRVATLAFLKALGDNENKIVKRAGVALGFMNQPETTTLPLIDALTTEHKFTVGGGGMQPVFGNGGGGLAMGGRPKTIKRDMKNDTVLHALTTMYQGVNFQFDQAAWRRWYVEQNTPRGVNLRRAE